MQFKFQTQVKHWELYWYNLINLRGQKTTYKHNLTRKILRYFFKKNIETTIYWFDFDQFGLTFQIHNSCYETMIILNHNKLWISILSIFIIE
jgi:hypothetical protein